MKVKLGIVQETPCSRFWWMGSEHTSGVFNVRVDHPFEHATHTQTSVHIYKMAIYNFSENLIPIFSLFLVKNSFDAINIFSNLNSLSRSTTNAGCGVSVCELRTDCDVCVVKRLRYFSSSHYFILGYVRPKYIEENRWQTKIACL